ncbi:hypothetical protein BRC86_14130 [Halobacteriales archaeon QS_3_64_16]|nr:MAG: hypothetical protein BRC86_14130 [Halobacteriales archaeon QS_3_64_16]
MISFEPAEEGLEVVDAVERHRYGLETGRRPTLEAANSEVFRAPIEDTVRFRSESVSLPTVAAIYARDEAGTVVAEAEHFVEEELSQGVYTLEICAPIKLYLRVESEVRINADARRTHIEFGEETEVTIGARSYHERPAATVTTTAEPRDLMAAISTFGSALKTTSPERSYPTLRGHPPTVELGETLQVPPELDVPDTGVRIELPPEPGPIFVAAPLAYYLGARLVPGEDAQIVANGGFEHALESARGFEVEVERALKQVFFLDCVTRTEGIYPVELAERREAESRIELDFAALYDRPLAERLETYLRVPFTAIEDLLPEWKLTTHIDPVAESVETLPFLVDDLAVVRTPAASAEKGSAAQMAAFEEFVRGEVAANAETFTRSRSVATQPSESNSYVQPEKTESLEQAWVGDGTPLGASKATAQAYRNRLDREPTEGPIEIAVVCNDPEMDEERADVDRVYGSRSELPFEVSMHHDLTTGELEAILTSGTDFLHYIGHIEAGGFECADGTLDASELESVGVGAFFLNGCASYEQGIALVERGAIGGVVTLTDVINTGAIRIGRAMGRLLNSGFPLGVALELAREESVVGSQYLVVGDTGLAVAQARNGFPNLCKVEQVGKTFRLEFETYPTSQKGLGSMIVPHIEGNETYSLLAGEPQAFELSVNELDQFLALEDAPVKVGEKLRWPDQIDAADWI